MSKWMIAILIVAGVTAQAKQLTKPDDNTFWMEDGKEIELGTTPNFKHWCLYKNKELEIKTKEDGKGFSFSAKAGKGGDTATQVRLSRDYPYLVFRITGMDILQGYTSWAVVMNGIQFFSSQATAPQKGIFVYDLYRNLPEDAAAKKSAYLHFYLTDIRLDFEFIKLVKKPDYVVRAECADSEIKPGSKVKFIAELAREAEDVSITLTTAGKPRPVKVNGELKIQLKPADKTQKIWTAEIEVKSIGLKKAVKRHQLFMKTDVLGGDLDEPVWVGLPYVVKP